ncbi:hypothetical protein GTY54_49410 [Streptomyces sp. SID625]|nr:hypothetical protein [Streptomyces sp. SID625]MYR63895.1 hypothetical protein [Streptomyces sp. SID625]
MGIKDFARSLRPGNDRELARTQYAGQQSATETARRQLQNASKAQREREAAQRKAEWQARESAARRQRHRTAVARDGDNQKGRVPKSWTHARE